MPSPPLPLHCWLGERGGGGSQGVAGIGTDPYCPGEGGGGGGRDGKGQSSIRDSWDPSSVHTSLGVKSSAAVT